MQKSINRPPDKENVQCTALASAVANTQVSKTCQPPNWLVVLTLRFLSASGTSPATMRCASLQRS